MQSSDSESLAKWTDVAFLNIGRAGSDHEGSFGIHETQFSFVICGLDNTRWVAYAFDDSEVDDESGDGLEDNVSSLGGLQEDPTAYNDDEVLDADLPLWDPREYFLRIFKSRTAQVLKEWEDLVLRVERSIKRDIDV